jgi:hypothetical protein
MSHQRLFPRWRCVVHNVQSYNFNLLSKHEFENCDIHKDITVGIIKPKTSGGVNGDISRAMFPDWNELCKFKENQKKLANKWNKFIEERRIEISKHRKKGFANRVRKVLQH